MEGTLQLGVVYKVHDVERYVMAVAEYTNGILTTGGLYKENELEAVDEPIVGITYTADMCTELPVDWHRILFLDDNNKRQYIKEVEFGVDRPYIMEDGTRSMEVTG